MCSKLKKAVIACFKKQIAARFPQFEIHSEVGKCTYWKAPSETKKVFFVQLDIHSDEEGFFIGIGWNDKWNNDILDLRTLQPQIFRY